MKCFLIRDSPNEMRQSLINISGLKVLKGGDEPRAQSSPHNDSVRPVRHSSFPSWAEFDFAAPRPWMAEVAGLDTHCLRRATRWWGHAVQRLGGRGHGRSRFEPPAV